MPAILLQPVQANQPESKLPSPAKSRLPSLDGWRALSILLVLGGHCERIYHYSPKWIPVFHWSDGALGVLCFFVISGFLITWLMLVENDRLGRISLKHFYIRRALRILPVFYTFLLTVAALQYFTPYSQNWLEWIGSLTFTQNFIDSPHTTAHLWSLSVEEQFYLLWPVTLVFLIKRGANSRQILGFLALPILAAPFCRAVGHHPSSAMLVPLLAGRSFFSYFDLLAVGCACAVYLANVRRTDCQKTIFHTHRRTILFAGLMLVLIPYVLDNIYDSHLILRILRVTVDPSFEALGFALLMLQSVFLPDWGIYRVLNWRWVCQIGVLSYSIYIWQQIFCNKPEALGLGRVWWMSFPGWLVPVFVVSFISYYGLERPILKLRVLFRDDRG
jgi:peptidoglycan/LPS O-acetylase OafA/YrhL